MVLPLSALCDQETRCDVVGKVRVGLIGAGFAAEFHAECWAAHPDVELVAVASRSGEKAEAFARKHGIASAYSDYRALLDHDDIDLVDVVTPNYAHKDPVIDTAEAGKHVVVEKPLTGYFGEDLEDGDAPIGERVSRTKMFEAAMTSGAAMVESCQRAGVMLGYAENFVYAPSLQKAGRLIEASGGTVLFIRSEEAHSGSHSPYSMQWKTSGGGSLIRMGSHPIGAVLYLKREEGERKLGRPIQVSAVTAQVKNMNETIKGAGDTKLVTTWEDVENWSCAIIEFDDNTVATLIAHDVCLGGLYNDIEIFGSNFRVKCNLNPNDACVAYAPDENVFQAEYLAEKLETKGGWSFPSVDESFLNGYPQQMSDFVECVRTGRRPLSDGALGLDVLKVVYAGYKSAELGRRVEM